MWKPPELSVSGGFFLIVGWFAVSCGGEAALLVLSAALLHELGHILALRLSGAGICWLRISVLGAIMETRGNLSYGQELLCLLAGPGANLLAAVLFGALDCDGLAGANAVLCLFNLLPVFPLDGGTVLYLLLSWLAGPQAAFWGSRCIGCGGRRRLLPCGMAHVADGREPVAAACGTGTAGGVNRRSAAGENILAILSLLLEI